MGFWEDLDAKNQEDIQNLRAEKQARREQEAQAEEEAQEQADAEAAEENKSWLDRAEDAVTNTAEWAWNGVSGAVESAAEVASETAGAISEGYQHASEGWNRVMDATTNLTAAYSPENVAEANETGDYSAQEEAISSAQEDAAAYREGLSDFAGSFTRPTRQALGNVIDEEAEEGSEYAQDFRATETFLDYFQSDAKKLERAKAIEEMTGIPQASFLNDETAYKEALKVYDDTQKAKKALGDDFSMDMVWQKYPELADVANMSPQDAAMALHHMDEVRSTHGIVESFQVMLEVGNKQLEYSNLQFKIGNGTATDADKERAEELKQELMNQQKELPSFFDEPLAAMVGGVAGSTPMMYHAAQESMQDAAAWWLAAMAAGAGAGSVVGPLGTATGASAGAAAGSVVGLARFGWLFVQNLSRMQKAGNAAAQIAKVSAKTGMVVDLEKQMVGQSYGELGELKDKNGNQLLDDKARWKYALAQGTAEMALEMAPLGVAKNALVGRPYARKMVGDILASAQARAGAVESMKTFARDRGLDVLKVAGAEAGEEGLQSVSDDIVHNQIAADTGDSSIGVYTWKDMAVRGLQASTEALPASLGFGLLSGFGGTMTGGLGRAAALRHQAAFEARYGKEAQQTMLGTAMFERIQNVLKNGKLKQDAPDVQRKVLRSQLAGTGYETVYIDTETAMEKENGAKDLQAVAKEAGLSDEELQQAIDQKGTITVAGEQFLQADSSPELLESVSFQPEAESMARMKKGAEQTLKAVQEQNERIIRQQEELQKGILDTYAPEDGTQEGTRKRQALTAILMLNPENPAEGWRQAHKEYRARLDDILAPALDALKAGMGRGGQIMDVKDEIGNDKTIRFTENSPWYQKFYAMNKRAPTKTELEDMAVALTTGDVNAPKVEGWVVTSKEQQDAMAQAKPEIEALQQRLADLDAIKGTARSLNGIEMELTQGLSKEGFQVYKALTRDIAKSPTRAARAARMSAIIFARHADLFAKKWAEKMGAKYTAKDYYAQRFGLDLEGKYKPGGAGFAQPVTNLNVNLDKPVKVLDFDAAGNELEGKTPKEIIQYINDKLSDAVENTADFLVAVGMPKSSIGKKHVVHARTKNIDEAISARNLTLSNFHDVIRHAYVIEETPNTKKGPITEDMSKNAKKTQRRKNSVQSYFRLMVPVKAGGKLRTLVLTAENFGEKVELDRTKTALYEAQYDKQERPLPALPRSASTYRIHAGSTDAPLTTSLREMLRGVKDSAGKPYVEADGRANYGISMENGVMLLDEEQAEQYQQMAWHGSPHTFDTFDLGAIGTGEGSQAHGWGLYFAKNRKVSENYRTMLSGAPKSVTIDGETYHTNMATVVNSKGETFTYPSQIHSVVQMLNQYGSVDRTVKEMKAIADNEDMREANREKAREILDFLKGKDVKVEQGGTLLSVDVPEDDELLDEQKPISAQPMYVRKALHALGVDKDKAAKGQAAYYQLASRLGSEKAASEALNEHGVKGIKYDGMEDGECFVVFDDKAVSIIEQYNQAAMYQNPSPDFKTFRARALAGETGPSYQYVGTGDNVLKVTSDDVKHIQRGVHEHPLTDAQWDDFVSHLDSIDEAHESGGILRPRGKVVVAKIKTAQNCFGAVFEFAKNGDVYVKTILPGTEKQVDALMKKREAGVRLHPGLPGRIAEASDSHAASPSHSLSSEREAGVLSHPGPPGRTTEAGDSQAVFPSHSLSVSSIQEELGIRKRNHEETTALSQAGGRINLGAITPLSDGRRIISLFEDADESTFVHEMGHLFLMDLEDLARVDDVSAKELQIVDDWATWHKGDAKEYKETKWADEFALYEQQIIDAEEHGDFETADKVKYRWKQERFARAFEIYLRDGKAPAKGLKGVFRTFRSWLLFIYKGFINDGGRASEPVRRVMDRMIATEDEIEAMKLDDRFRDVEAAGGEKLLTEDERDTYERWQQEAREHAKDELMKTVMKDLTEKKQQAFDARLKSERERRVRELQQEPAAIAMQAAQSSGSDEIVLNWYPSKEAFADAYDKWSEDWERLDDDMAAYAKELDAELMQTYLSEEAAAKALESSEYHAKLEGLVATALAKKLGLVNKITSKAERAMMSIEDKLTALPEEVDLKLQKDSAPVKKLMKAINELRFSTRWSAKDYHEIERMVRAATKEDIKDALKEIKASEREDKQNEKAVLEANQGRLATYKKLAAERIQKMELSEATNVRRFRRQEQQAARRVQQMIRAKHWEMAVHMQEQKAMAAELAKAAEKMQAEVQKKLEKVKKQLTARTVKLPRDERYWHRHLAYLLRMTNKDAEKPAPRQVKDADGKVVRTEEVQGLTELFQSMKDNLDVDTPPIDFLEKAAAAGENFRGWRSLTKAEFDDAVDALTMLYTTGRDKFRMKTIGGKDIAEVLDEIMNDTGDASYMKVNRDLINEDAGGLGYNGWLGRVPGLGQALARYGQEYLSVIMKPEEILRALGKTAHAYIYGIYEKAITREAERLETAVKDLRALRAGYTHKEVEGWQKKRWTLETSEGTTPISKENVLAMALNLGTRNNVQRLVDGFGMREEDVRKFVYEHMTEKDWTFVQSIWDYLSSYWPETVAVEEQLNGTTLKKEPAAAFDVKTADGKIVHLKGGYYPIQYNPEKSIHAMNQEENRMAQSAMAGAQVLGTGRGFTKGRAQYVARPLLLELHVIPDHVQQVIHNIEVRIPARDVYRLVYSKQMEDKVTSTMGADYYKILTEWATDVWNIVPTETNQATNKANRLLSYLRRNSVMAIMGYRLWPVIENASNIGPVMEKLGATHALGAVANFYSHFEANKDLLYKSVFMRNRINSMDRDIRSQEGLFQADWRPFEIIRGHAYDMMLYSDLALSAPLWTQTYKDAFSRKLGEVQRENEARVKAIMDGQARVDAARAAIIDARTAAAEAQERQRAEAQRAAELADAAYTHVGAEDALFQNEEQAGGSPFDVKAQGENEVGAGAPDGAIAGTSDNAALSTASRSPFPKGEGLEDAAGGILDDTQEAPKSLKELQKELAEAEDAFAKAQEAEILDEDAVVKEAERRSVAEADAAIRDTFGSGRAMDLASIQRQKSEAMKLMTVFYSFFNTQFNAIFAAYRHGKYAGRTEGTIRRWAPFARSMIYRVVVMSLVGCLLKYALGIEGSDDKDKWKKVKNPETGKEEQQEVPPLERFLKVFGKNTLSQMAGSFVLVRDIVNLGINYAFDGTTYGRGINPMESSFRSFSEAGEAFDLLLRKGEKDLQIEEKHAKEAQEQAERLKKLKGKKRKEYLQKLEEDAKYKKPDERITYSEILRHAANAGVTLTATHTGLTSTLVDAITGTMQYLNDADGRYDSTWKQIFWSALFDKKPVEREIPKRPPAPPKKKKKQAK